MIPGRKPLFCIAAMISATLGVGAGTPLCMADEKEPHALQGYGRVSLEVPDTSDGPAVFRCEDDTAPGWGSERAADGSSPLRTQYQMATMNWLNVWPSVYDSYWSPKTCPVPARLHIATRRYGVCIFAASKERRGAT